ncbi:uncharacterized protein LOC132613329 [Lycium barbarum]|uniref:uncharacterized protein LOC132613329 n=1 Tax=Lycium barbarum TaxID=112863 RepID=UPI00293EE958|nr:uncharacterized protein LOC132613329 [Lycium barbarum]
MVEHEDNNRLCSLPDEIEIRQAVFDLNPNSAPDLDGFGGCFYQSCWQIIKDDMVDFVQSFFRGANLTKFYTSTCLVLISKVEHPASFTEFRPISLSNFTNKILSKILSSRLLPMLNKLTSENQSDFIPSRMITENILLAQEVIHDIRKENEGGNMVLKLDMSKAYDRVDWEFLTAVLKRFRFFDLRINMVWRLVSGNWYSILINGHMRGFLNSTRGLKQGDPLSLSLFLLSAEVLSKMLNMLPLNHHFTGFHIQSQGPQITHLAYADDVIIFSSENHRSIELVLQQLWFYEKCSGQKINVNKSCFLVAPNTNDSVVQSLKVFTGFKHSVFPITYLGCPLYVGRKKIAFFNEVVSKIVRKSNGWQAVVDPPKIVIRQIESYLASFFWGSSNGKQRYHWSSWDKLCFPTKEGVLGFRIIRDISESFAYKRLWRFRAIRSLWSEFLNAKYCRRVGLVERKFQSGQSHCWKKLMEVKFEAEKNILWRVNKGEIKLWWDNWTGQRALANSFHVEGANSKMLIKDARQNEVWNFLEFHQLLEYLIELFQSIEFGDPNLPEHAIWMSSIFGNFTTKTAWKLVRQTRTNINTLEKIWHKFLPFKMSFIVWRALKRKLPFDDIIVRFNIDIVSRCHC